MLNAPQRCRRSRPLFRFACPGRSARIHANARQSGMIEIELATADIVCALTRLLTLAVLRTLIEALVGR